MDFTRLFEILEYQNQRYPQPAALSGRENGVWRSWSTAEVLSERDRLSLGLLHLGLQQGDRVGVLAHCGSPRWVIADAAMLQIGVVPVPIHTTARPDEMTEIARDAELRACWVSNVAMLEKLQAAGITPKWVLGFEPVIGVQAWSDLLRPPAAAEQAQLETLRDSIHPDDLATLLYTSGTTGTPKGVMLSHANIVSNVKSVLAIVPVGTETTTVSFLPLSHIFERMVTYAYQAAGAPIWYVESVERLADTLREVRPHFFAAVPRILERMHERLLEERDRSGAVQRRVFDWALELGERFPFSGARNMPFGYRLQRALADFLVFRHWRKKMGGRLQAIAVGAAALQPRLGRLFSAAGVDVREGYGLTETSPVLAFNRFEPGGVRFGTVGIPAPGVDVRIAAPDATGVGDIEVRGPNVTRGYWNRPEDTAARFTPDGWFKTGDVGCFEHKRFLRITGRRSEIFKTTSGKFVAPAFVEQQLTTSPFISQAMVIGLNRPYAGALIVPNFDHLEAWCRANKVHWTAPQFMLLNPKVEKIYRQEIRRINDEQLGTVEKVQQFRLLQEPWTAENGLLTPTLKLRREVIAKQFADDVEAVFAPGNRRLQDEEKNNEL